jgi:uncharacterized Zn-binding protein involved in type VI secretion
MSQKPAARVGDATECPKDNDPPAHVGGKIVAGSSNIFINGKPAARLGDAISGCEDGSDDAIADGSSSVSFNGRPAARVGDATDHDGSITAGSGSVVIGTGGSPVRFGNFGKIRFGSLGNTRIGGLTVSPAPMGLPPLPVDLELFYHTVVGEKPIANAHYTASFVDGTVKTGQLDANGYAHLSDVPPGPCKVCYSTNKASDTKPGEFEKLQAKRYALRENIKKDLDAMISALKTASAPKQKALDNANPFQKNFMIAEAVLKGGYNFLNDTVDGFMILAEGIGDVTGKALKIGRNFISTSASKGVGTATSELKNTASEATQHAQQWISATEEEVQTAFWILEDDEMRDIFTQFMGEYFASLDTLSTVEKGTQLAIPGLFYFILVLLTGGQALALGVPAAATAFSKIGSKLKEFSLVKKTLSHIKKYKDTAFKKLSNIIQKRDKKAILITNGRHSRGSTGRLQPKNLKEQTAMREVMSSPEKGEPIPRMKMSDPRWPASDGWVKMSKRVNDIEIHYVRNARTGIVDDFKFK